MVQDADRAVNDIVDVCMIDPEIGAAIQVQRLAGRGKCVRHARARKAWTINPARPDVYELHPAHRMRAGGSLLGSRLAQRHSRSG